MMKNFLFVFVALALVPSLALAGGGGGTKATGVINVKNNGNLVTGVLVLPKGVAPPAATQAAFTAAGGKFVDAGQTASFTKLKNGSYTVYVFQVLAAGPGNVFSKSYDLVKGANNINCVVTWSGDGGTADFAP